MATCTNICGVPKYTQDELRHFIDRVENVLQNQECRGEFCEFLKETKKFDLVKYVKIWKLVNDMVEKRPDSPEPEPKNELKETLEDIPRLEEFADNFEEEDNLLELRKKVCRELGKGHKLFARHLRNEYK